MRPEAAHFLRRWSCLPPHFRHSRSGCSLVHSSSWPCISVQGHPFWQQSLSCICCGVLKICCIENSRLANARRPKKERQEKDAIGSAPLPSVGISQKPQHTPATPDSPPDATLVSQTRTSLPSHYLPRIATYCARSLQQVYHLRTSGAVGQCRRWQNVFSASGSTTRNINNNNATTPTSWTGLDFILTLRPSTLPSSLQHGFTSSRTSPVAAIAYADSVSLCSTSNHVCINTQPIVGLEHLLQWLSISAHSGSHPHISRQL